MSRDLKELDGRVKTLTVYYRGVNFIKKTCTMKKKINKKKCKEKISWVKVEKRKQMASGLVFRKEE